jgi:hypothetical protein
MLMKKVEKIAKQIRDERDKGISIVSDRQLIEKEQRREAVLSNILCFSLGSILLSGY